MQKFPFVLTAKYLYVVWIVLFILLVVLLFLGSRENADSLSQIRIIVGILCYLAYYLKKFKLSYMPIIFLTIGIFYWCLGMQDEYQQMVGYGYWSLIFLLCWVIYSSLFKKEVKK